MSGLAQRHDSTGPRQQPLVRGLQLLGLARVPPVALVAVLGLDQLQKRYAHGILAAGLLDEPAHAATALLALLAFAGAPWLVRHPQLSLSALVCSMAIDVDHIPLYLGVPHIAAGGRPDSHSLVTVATLGAAYLLTGRRPWLLGAGIGVLLHFVRDVATGPGLRLWWPLGSADVRAPYPAYIAALGVLTLLAVVRSFQRQTSV